MEVMVTCKCSYCGKNFEVIPSRLKWGRGKHCSPECQYSAIRNRLPKTEIIWFSCRNCGKDFWKYAKRVEQDRGVGKYCSRQCRDEHWRGEYNPNFIHGNKTNWHGANWYSQRRKAKKRDKFRCVKCELSDAECMEKYSQPLHVHHRIPYRLFQGDFRSANKLSNLETLCPVCHRKSEAILRKRERGISTIK